MQTQDIKGLLYSLDSYCRQVLEYDQVDTSCKIKADKYEITVNCDDDFQKRAEWNKKVEQILFTEPFDYETTLAEASKAIFARLERTMKRDERELQFGLNLIGQGIEAGASYRSHVGLEFLAGLKREQEKTMLMLPDRTGEKQAPVKSQPNEDEQQCETVGVLDPYLSEGMLQTQKELDDEIPF